MLLTTPTQLPFPIDKILPGNEVSDFGNYNFPIPQSGPEATTHLRTIAALMAQAISNSAGRGPITCFAYNLFSHNRWNNNPWLSIIADTYDLAVNIQKVNPNADIYAVLSSAVQRYGNYAVSACIEKFPDLAKVVDQQRIMVAMNEINKYRMELKNLMDMVGRIQSNTTQAEAYNPSTMTQTTNSGMIVGGVGYYENNTNSDGSAAGWVRPEQRPLSRKVSKKRAKEQAKEDEVRSQVIDDLTSNNRLSEVNFASLRINQTLPETDFVQDAPVRLTPPRRAISKRLAKQLSLEQTTPEPGPVNEPIVSTGFPETLIEQPVQLVDNHDDIEVEDEVEFDVKLGRTVIIPINIMEPDEAFSDDSSVIDGVHYESLSLIENEDESFGNWVAADGSVVRVVSADTIGWCMRLGQLTRTPYDPRKWHRVFIQQTKFNGELNGEIVEGFMKVEEGDPMDLLDIELDPAARARLVAEMNFDKRYIPVGTGFVDLSHNPSGFNLRTKTQPEDADAPVSKPSLQKVIAPRSLLSLEDAISSLSVAASLTYQSSVAFVTEVFTGISPNGLVISKLGDLVKDNKSDTAYGMLSLHNEMTTALPMLSKLLDRILTKEVNLILNYSFGVETSTIESFVEDYEDLNDLILNIYGEEASIVFNDAVNGLLKRFKRRMGDAFGTIDPMFYLQGDLLDYGVQLVSSKTGFIKLSKCEPLTQIISLHMGAEAFPDSFYLITATCDTWRCIRSAWDQSHYSMILV